MEERITKQIGEETLQHFLIVQSDTLAQKAVLATLPLAARTPLVNQENISEKVSVLQENKSDSEYIVSEEWIERNR